MHGMMNAFSNLIYTLVHLINGGGGFLTKKRGGVLENLLKEGGITFGRVKFV